MKDDIRRIIDTKRRASPMKSYLWYVELPIDIENFDGEVFEINSRISSINIPYPTFETDKEVQGNSWWYYAKSIDIGSITLEIVEHEDGKSFEYFQAWQKMIANQNGTFNPPKYYKKNVRVFRLDQARNKLIVDVYEGYFISGISDLANDYESNNLVKFTVTLTGDNVRHVNLIKPNTKLEPEINRLAQVTELLISSKEFIDKVQSAKISKQSLTELLL